MCFAGRTKLHLIVAISYFGDGSGSNNLDTLSRVFHVQTRCLIYRLNTERSKRLS